MIPQNKHGQALGRKGLESRQRLLTAGRGLLERKPTQKLTPSAVAHAAGMASQTFYLYFTDINELVLVLSQEASADTAEVLEALQAPWSPGDQANNSRRFVEAFYRYWDRHRAILSLRNFQSDLGDVALTRVRHDAALPIITAIARRIRSAQGEDLISDTDAMARSVIIFAAIERLAARPATRSLQFHRLGRSDLQRAEADILTLLLTPSAASLDRPTG